MLIPNQTKRYMDVITIGAIIGIIILLGILSLIVRFVINNAKVKNQILEGQVQTWQDKYKKLIGQKKSSEINLGLVSEQIAPFLDIFKHNPQKCRFMGEPIDYICFNDDEIIFIEVKSQKSTLIPKQRKIKKLIDAGKVRFEVIQIEGDQSDPEEENKK